MRGDDSSAVDPQRHAVTPGGPPHPAPVRAAPPLTAPPLTAPPASTRRPLFELWPRLEAELGFLPLGDFPTPIERLDLTAGGAGAEVYVKRDDASSPLYGGNKVRTLEALLGQARRQANTHVIAAGAYGSNHAVATLLHARRAGFRVGVALFPQPCSQTAADNLRVSVTQADEIVDLAHWSLLPYALRRFGGVARPPPAPFAMPPGGAIPRGCLGFLSAGLELSLQIDAGVAPRPDEVILALGSTCSTAGLLVGLRLAARLGLGLGRGTNTAAARRGVALRAPPRLVAVRVTPWPLTSAFRIARLARRVSTWLYAKTGDAVFDISRGELLSGLELDGSQLGSGYGQPTTAGLDSIAALSRFSFALDTSYSAKSAAALLARLQAAPRVRLYWCTKSSAPLPDVPEVKLARAPERMLRWLDRCGERPGHARSLHAAASRETRSPRRVSPNVEEGPSAECPIGPGSTRPPSRSGVRRTRHELGARGTSAAPTCRSSR
jgi:D-cysteine desulfhydrase